MEDFTQPQRDTLTEEELQRKEFKKCYNQALRHLAKKDYSEYKLKKKLREKDFDRDCIRKVIDELIEQNYLREDLYKEARVKGLLRKGYSPQVVKYKMSQEFCETTIDEIENIAHDADYSTGDQLRELVEKKVRIDYDFVADKRKLKDRVLRYAANRGHSVGKAAHYYDQIIEENYS